MKFSAVNMCRLLGWLKCRQESDYIGACTLSSTFDVVRET